MLNCRWLVRGRLCGVLNPTAAHAACAAAHWQSSQTVWQLLLAQDTVRMPSNAALVTGYAVACHRDSLRNLCGRKTPRAALRQLACCKTLASQARSRQNIACGSLQTSLVPQECIKTTHLRIQTGQARRLRRQQPCQPLRRPSCACRTSPRAKMQSKSLLVVQEKCAES